MCCSVFFFFFKQKTAYELRISDWSSDVCSSDLDGDVHELPDASAEARAAQADPEAARANWYARKRAHLDNAIDADDKVLLVMACEKLQIGRASCRERVCQFGSISVVAVS